MKKIFTLLFFVAFVGTMAFAQEKSLATATAEQVVADGPIMTFESTTVDYGEIEQNSDPLRKFNFTNTGNKPLQITHAKGSCGCTVPDWPKEPIMPGERATIDVRYDTKRPGPFVKSITLTTNEAVGKQKLTIKGKVNRKAPEADGLPKSDSMFAPTGN